MEVQSGLIDDETDRSSSSPSSLTPLVMVRGVVCLLILVVTAFMMLVYIGFAASGILRFFSVHYSRKVTSLFFGAWLSLWPCLFEKINGTRVVFSGDAVPPRERVLIIANHRTEVDWMYLWDLACRKGRVGHIKYILKDSLMKLPMFGWAFHVMEFVPVARKWEVDEPVMQRKLSAFLDPRDPLWLALFPEGTDFTEQKCIRSQKYAMENGLPILNHVLLPKTKGFFACMDTLRGSLDAVYDITIAYKQSYPTFMDNVYGLAPSEVHIHVQRVSLEDVPTSEEEVNEWLIETFRLKDQMLSDFHSRGSFPEQRTENPLSTARCLLNFASIILVTSVCVYLTFFSSGWFQIYVFFVIAYFTCVTYFDFRPTPIADFFKPRLKQNLS